MTPCALGMGSMQNSLGRGDNLSLPLLGEMGGLGCPPSVSCAPVQLRSGKEIFILLTPLADCCALFTNGGPWRYSV